jgi:hypothetical protein
VGLCDIAVMLAAFEVLSFDIQGLANRHANVDVMLASVLHGNKT